MGQLISPSPSLYYEVCSFPLNYEKRKANDPKSIKCLCGAKRIRKERVPQQGALAAKVQKKEYVKVEEEPLFFSDSFFISFYYLVQRRDQWISQSEFNSLTPRVCLFFLAVGSDLIKYKELIPFLFSSDSREKKGQVLMKESIFSIESYSNRFLNLMSDFLRIFLHPSLIQILGNLFFHGELMN